MWNKMFLRLNTLNVNEITFCIPDFNKTANARDCMFVSFDL